jgi:hypothetical protein
MSSKDVFILILQAFLGLFSAIAWVATIAVPVLLTEVQPFGIGTIGVRNMWSGFEETFSVKSKFGSLFNERTARKIGLEWDPCLDKAICEAHRSPKKYGLLATPFLALYP